MMGKLVAATSNEDVNILINYLRQHFNIISRKKIE